MVSTRFVPARLGRPQRFASHAFLVGGGLVAILLGGGCGDPYEGDEEPVEETEQAVFGPGSRAIETVALHSNRTTKAIDKPQYEIDATMGVRNSRRDPFDLSRLPSDANSLVTWGNVVQFSFTNLLNVPLRVGGIRDQSTCERPRFGFSNGRSTLAGFSRSGQPADSMTQPVRVQPGATFRWTLQCFQRERIGGTYKFVIFRMDGQPI